MSRSSPLERRHHLMNDSTPVHRRHHLDPTLCIDLSGSSPNSGGNPISGRPLALRRSGRLTSSPAKDLSAVQLSPLAPQPSDLNKDESEGEGEEVKIMVDAHVFIRDEEASKNGKTVYLEASSIGNELIWPTNDRNLPNFLQAAAKVCAQHMKGMDVLIEEATKNPTKITKWTATIDRTRSFPKTTKNQKELTEDNFDDYIDEVIDYTSRTSSVIFWMSNPKTQKSAVQKASQVKKASERVVRQIGRKEKKKADAVAGGHSEGEEVSSPAHSSARSESSSSADRNREFMNFINHHKIKPAYSKSLPVWVDPSNPDLYIELEHHIAQQWFVKMGEDGVDWDTPPRQIKVLNRRKRKEMDTAPSNPFDPTMVSSLVTGVLNGIGVTPGRPFASTASDTPADLPSPAGIPLTRDQRGIEGFIDLPDLPAPTTQTAKEKLLAGDIFDFTLLNPKDLPRDALTCLGLSVGLIAELYRGVSKYKHHIQSELAH